MKRKKTWELVTMGLLAAIVFVVQVALGFLPNIELVTLLFIVYTLVLGKRVFLIIYVFVFLEGFFYGFGIWWINYLYVWTIEALITLALRKQTSVLFWSVMSGIYGFTFGAWCAIPYFFIGGPSAAFSYWISGIPYSVLNCVGNIVICLVLFKPLYKILNMIWKGMDRNRLSR